jgi:hypothetical protein
MKDWRKALLLGGMLVGLALVSGGCTVATTEDPAERWDEVAEELTKGPAPAEASADDDGDDGAPGGEHDLPELEIPVDPIPWFPGSDRFEAVAPDPVPWQPDTSGCSDSADR